MKVTTYTRRENARRAALASGIPKERVAITIHKNGSEVRFGWRECCITTKTVTTASPRGHVSKILEEQSNGLKRPKAGGLCAAVWEWLNSNPKATVKAVREVAPLKGWNTNNACCEFYAWRKFHGIVGRLPKLV